MNDGGIDALFRAESASISYAVPDGAAVGVKVDDAVRAGQPLADVPRAPHVIAFAEELRLPHTATNIAMASLDSTSVAADAPLGNHRVGLRTRTLRAPHGGTAHALPEYDTLIVRPDEGRDVIRAACSGVVASVEVGAITVLSRVIRCSYAFAAGPQSGAGRLAVFPEVADMPARARVDASDPGHVMTALANIDNIKDLASALRRMPGPLIVGTVSDAVAWELLARTTAATDRDRRTVIVLLGPGDRPAGASAIQQLQHYDGASIDIDRHTHTITLYPDDLPDDMGTGTPDGSHTRAAVYLDPARWRVPCVVAGTAHIGILATGVRTFVVRTSRNGTTEERTPCSNIATHAES